MEQWAAATAVERFFVEAEKRLEHLGEDRREHIQSRLALARAMLGEQDPLSYLADWLAPDERYQTRYPDQ